MNVSRSGRWLRVGAAVLRVDEIAAVHISSANDEMVQVLLIARGNVLITEAFLCDDNSAAESLVFDIFAALRSEP